MRRASLLALLRLSATSACRVVTPTTGPGGDIGDGATHRQPRDSGGASSSQLGVEAPASTVR